MKLSDNELKFLNNNGWKTFYYKDHLKMISEETGCTILGSFASELTEKFARETIEEIKEELLSAEEKTLPLSEKQILNLGGFSLTCESPYELEDENGDVITGQCAKWLSQELVSSYKKTLLS